MIDELAFYSTHGAITDPGAYAFMFDGAPDDAVELARWVRNVQFHEAYARDAGLTLPSDAADDPATSDAAVRYVAAMLGRIVCRDDRRLGEERPKHRCFIGTCRDYAVLLCALLRHRGRPARVRCGFTFYFEPDEDFGDDHWVTEVWVADEARWRLVDAEVDASLTQHAKVSIDPCDVPRDRFQVAGAAWRLCRKGGVGADRYGVASIGVHGEWFMAANVVRDLAALNKREMAPFDYWGMSLDICLAMDLNDGQRALIDRLAAVTADDGFDFSALRDIYESSAGVRVSDPVKGWPKGVKTDFTVGLA